MKRKTNIKLELSDNERTNLRKNKIKKSAILEYASDELSVLLNVSDVRAKDLVFLGYYSIEELNGKSGVELTDHYEKKKGYKTDPCVEDQFRLAVDFAKNKDYSKKWWNFTNERKEYRTKIGYPKDRPKINWTEALNVE